MHLETLVTYVIEVIDFKSEVRFDLRGCLELLQPQTHQKGQYKQYAHGYVGN